VPFGNNTTFAHSSLLFSSPPEPNSTSLINCLSFFPFRFVPDSLYPFLCFLYLKADQFAATSADPTTLLWLVDTYARVSGQGSGTGSH
jgi:hypothetical protein